MTVVIDASVVVAALVDTGDDGGWAEQMLASLPLAAPAHMPVEVANVLRRAVLAGALSADVASLAHRDLLALPVELFPYHAVGERVWELRGSITAYDAAYVALAEHLQAPLATLDGRLGRAAGIRCELRTPTS